MLERFITGHSTLFHITFIVGVLAVVHLAVTGVRRLGNRMTLLTQSRRVSKLRTVASLVTSIAVFSLYFLGLGLIIREFGLSIKSYLASASIMGLALGFGSQGMVQDVVTGVTLVFADLFDVGDMVEISGQAGIVRSVGMRFTVLENSLGALVYIPNRTIANVVNYPRGYVRALLDVRVPAGLATDQVSELVTRITGNCHEQMPGIFITAPSAEGLIRTAAGTTILRIKFRIWPGRGAVLETNLKTEIVQSLKVLDDTYQDWMVAISYEAERKSTRTA